MTPGKVRNASMGYDRSQQWLLWIKRRRNVKQGIIASGVFSLRKERALAVSCNARGSASVKRMKKRGGKLYVKQLFVSKEKPD